jgi:hypothetical protein
VDEGGEVVGREGEQSDAGSETSDGGCKYGTGDKVVISIEAVVEFRRCKRADGSLDVERSIDLRGEDLLRLG